MVVVRPQRRQGYIEERAQDAVLIEAHDRLEGFFDLLANPLALGPVPARRVEAGFEEIHDKPGEVLVDDEGVLHVILGERRACMAQVLAVGPEHRDLTPGTGEGVLEDLPDLTRLQLVVGLVDEAEVIYPDRRRALRLDLVRAFVDHLDAHVLQQRQNLRERDLLPELEQLETKEVLGLFDRMVEAHLQVIVGLQPLHPLDVRDGRAGQEACAVARGEGVAVLAEQLCAPFLAVLFDQGVVEVVRPGAGRLDEAAFDLFLIVFRFLPRLRVDYEMDAREHRLREPDVVLYVYSIEGLEEYVLHAFPDHGVVAVTGHEDQAGEKAPVGVAPDEESDALSLLQVEYSHRYLEELLLGDLEQLVARVGLQDLDQVLLVVAPLWKTRPLQNVTHLAPYERDVEGARAVGGEGVESEESLLSRDLARLIKFFDADVVEVGCPVHRRSRVRLRQVQELGRAGEPPHPWRKFGEAAGDRSRLRLPQDAEPGSLHGAEGLFTVLRGQVVLAVAEEREVVVVDPLQERSGLGQVLRLEDVRVLLEQGDYVPGR